MSLTKQRMLFIGFAVAVSVNGLGAGMVNARSSVSEQWVNHSAASAASVPTNYESTHPKEIHPSARPAMCGDDLGTPRVGMPLSRAKQCVGKLKLAKEFNRTDGSVAIYSAGSTYLTVKHGHVIAFSLQ